jgi:hypothetical protein
MISSRSILPSVVTGSCCVRRDCSQALPDSAEAERWSLTDCSIGFSESHSAAWPRGNPSSGASSRPTLVGVSRAAAQRRLYPLPPRPFEIQVCTAPIVFARDRQRTKRRRVCAGDQLDDTATLAASPSTPSSPRGRGPWQFCGRELRRNQSVGNSKLPIR